MRPFFAWIALWLGCLYVAKACAATWHLDTADCVSVGMAAGFAALFIDGWRPPKC